MRPHDKCGRDNSGGIRGGDGDTMLDKARLVILESSHGAAPAP